VQLCATHPSTSPVLLLFRLLLEETAIAYSSAGPALAAPGNLLVGVYVGCMYHEYLDVMAGSGMKLPPQAFMGNGAPYMVGRLSYSFGFTGERCLPACLPWLVENTHICVSVS
jgi:hypothetical protein